MKTFSDFKSALYKEYLSFNEADNDRAYESAGEESPVSKDYFFGGSDLISSTYSRWFNNIARIRKLRVDYTVYPSGRIKSYYVDKAPRPPTASVTIDSLQTLLEKKKKLKKIVKDVDSVIKSKIDFTKFFVKYEIYPVTAVTTISEIETSLYHLLTSMSTFYDSIVNKKVTPTPILTEVYENLKAKIKTIFIYDLNDTFKDLDELVL